YKKESFRPGRRDASEGAGFRPSSRKIDRGGTDRAARALRGCESHRRHDLVKSQCSSRLTTDRSADASPATGLMFEHDAIDRMLDKAIRLPSNRGSDDIGKVRVSGMTTI